jgi:hypothetical protein
MVTEAVDGYRLLASRCTEHLRGLAGPKGAVFMPTITVARGDVASEEVIEALRAGLGGRYQVLPEERASHLFGTPRAGEPGAIVVGLGSGRVWCTEVRIGHGGGVTRIQVAGPPRPPLMWLVNAFLVTRRVHRVLQGLPASS